MQLIHKLSFKGMKDKRFFLHPKPIKGELLSSWLVRIALSHRIAPVTFMNIHFPQLKPDIWSRDVDLYWGTRPNLLELLSYKSRVPINELFQCTLISYEGYLNEKIYANTRNKLITPLVNRGREIRSPGLRYCPQCLQEDDVPFFRKEWRLSFVTTCLKHRCFLKDCCPICKSTVNIHKLIQNDNICHCYKCNSSYLDTEIEIVPYNSYGIQAQKKFLKTLNSGLFTFENKLHYSLAYFNALKQMAKVIYNFGIREGINEYEIYHNIHPLPVFDKKPFVFVEDILLREQYIVYSVSEYVLQSLEHINIFCNINKIGKTELIHSIEYVPYWYSCIVQQNDHTKYTISPGEAKSALVYLKKQGYPLSFKYLSKLTGITLEKRKRMDIYKLLNMMSSKI